MSSALQLPAATSLKLMMLSRDLFLCEVEVKLLENWIVALSVLLNLWRLID